MAVREGRWELLGRDSDPVVADRVGVDDRVSHYQQVAEAIRTESGRLHRIASGDALRGAYADALRSSAGDVAKDLDQVQQRYDAVAGALRDYAPALDSALSGSWQALQDAEDADAAAARANAMPQDTASQGQTLTVAQQAQDDDRSRAVNDAADRLAAAKAKLTGVLAELDDAGRAAASRVRGGFGDGLTDSTWDRVKSFFVAALKVIIKLCTYVAMALAVLALLIPGLGEVAFVIGMAASAVLVAANGALVGMGEGSWLDFGIAVGGLLTFGVGKAFGPAIKAAVSKAAAGAGGGVRGLGAGVRTAGGEPGEAIEMSAVGGARGGAGSNASDASEASRAARSGSAGSGDVVLGLRGGAGGRGLRDRYGALVAQFGRRGAPSPSPSPEGDPAPTVDWEPPTGHLERGQAADMPAGIAQYARGTYNQINGTLRGSGAMAARIGNGGAGADDVFKWVGGATQVDKYIGLNSTGQVITTFRGVRGDFGSQLQQLRPGDAFAEDGFLSTSTDQQFAWSWAHGGGREPLPGATVLEMTGTSGSAIGNVEQFEHLYPSGTQWVVTGTGEVRGLPSISVQEVPTLRPAPGATPSAADPTAGRSAWAS